MAKPTQKTQSRAVAPANNKSRQVAAKTSANLPAHIANRQHTGAGVSSDVSDNLVPLIYILQAQSPQALPKSPDFIEGATAGAIWLRNAPKDQQIVDGDEGILFQPCHFDKVWIEWKPDRGGFVARHKERPAAAEQKTKDPKKPDRLHWEMPNGNVVVETREHSGFVHLDDGTRFPYTIPFSSSGHTVSRGWMTSMNRKVVGGSIADSFCYLYRLTTQFRENDDGSWFLFEVNDHDWVQEESDIEMGAALAMAFKSGAKQTMDGGDDTDTTTGSAGSAPRRNADKI
jgi:hypothetical protein